MTDIERIEELLDELIRMAFRDNTYIFDDTWRARDELMAAIKELKGE